jgi:hypothetical protein
VFIADAGRVTVICSLCYLQAAYRNETAQLSRLIRVSSRLSMAATALAVRPRSVKGKIDRVPQTGGRRGRAVGGGIRMERTRYTDAK